MIGVFYGLLATALIAAGVLCAYEARSYTDEQRARATRLWKAYLGCGPLLIVTGGGAIVGLLTGFDVWTIHGLVVLVAALPCLVQYLLHRELEIERSPLGDRIAERVARKLNVPEAREQA